ncbi:Uncharacterised protein [uncultured archaeon]|nr:Uncharacterised protein [uncultured archaeon]
MATFESTPVSLFRSDDFPALGNPTSTTVASPDFLTAKPVPCLAFFSAMAFRIFAIFERRIPRYLLVALLYFVFE